MRLIPSPVRLSQLACACVVGVLLFAAPRVAVGANVLEEPPVYGSFYDRYEPSFYTGFAPRSTEPERVHLHVGRGNQLRVTVVVSDEVVRDYARDLYARRHIYRTLADEKRIELTQNDGLAVFEQRLDQIELARLVREEAGLSAGALRTRNLALMEQLNPGRVFRITLDEDRLVRQWLARLTPEDARSLDRDRRLALVNALLPTRLWLAELDKATIEELRILVGFGAARASDDDPIAPELRTAYFRLLTRVSGGLYPRREGTLQFVEFTAIYPIGTVNEYTKHNGRQIPLYPTPGRRALTTHQRSKTVDHIPTVAVYSYSPWIPYMHVGTRLHNSFHTLWWRMQPDRTSFLPPAWRDAAREGREKPYQYLWLLSRGPMSHGCTHLTTGHIAELRHMFPSQTAKLYEIDVFLNKSYLYDVFDIDGDFTPEVMGVRYFIAYSLANKKPNKLRVRNERRAYYDWLYGGELRLDDAGNGSFGKIRDGRFVERTAKTGAEYDGLKLYEAGYEPERFQMYKLIDIPFARELRKVSVHHPFEGVASPQVAPAGGAQ